MKKVYSLVYILLAVFILSGCADNRLAAEKLFWQAEKTSAEILKGKTQGEVTDKDLERIILSYRKVTNKFPVEPLAAKAHFVIANIYISEKKYEKAQDEFKRVIENFSRKAKIASAAQFAIGKVFELQGEPKKALAEYEKVTDAYPLSSLGLETPLYISQYHKKLNDPEGQKKAHRQAVRHYKKIIGDYADTDIAGIVQNYLAQAHLQSEDWGQAIKVWDEIIIKYPNTPQAIRGLMAKAEVRAKELDDLAGAIKIYKECVEKYAKAPFIKEVKLRLGSLYLKNSQIKEAKEVFTKLGKDYPDDENIAVRSRFGIINCLQKEGLKNQVIESYQKIQSAYPDNQAVFSTPYLVYRYYKQINDSENAEKSLETAISNYKKEFSAKSKDKKNLILARLLFLCYAEKKDWNNALGLLKTLADNNPKDPGYLLSMAFIHFKELGDSKKAKTIYEEIINKYSANKKLVKLVKGQITALDKAVSNTNK